MTNPESQMNEEEEGQQQHEEAVAAYAMSEREASPGLANDAATLDSNAAMIGSVGGGSGDREPLTVAPVPAVSVLPNSNGVATLAEAAEAHGRQHIQQLAHASGGGGGNNSRNGHVSSLSLVNSSNTMGSSIMPEGANSIVSFGNFNFDGASSPSDSGGDKNSSEEENGNGNGNQAAGDQAAAAGPSGSGDAPPAEDKKNKKAKHGHPGKRGPGSGSGAQAKAGGGGGSKEAKSGGCRSSNKPSNKSATVKFLDPNGEVYGARSSSGDGGFTSSQESDSSTNANDSGGSSSGGSGNDGSSGEKSTISSLTTSSNQEWMATNESAEAARRADAQDRGDGGKKGGDGRKAANGASAKMPSPSKKDGSGKKRKKPTSSSSSKPSSEQDPSAAKPAGEDDGYKTDEEQWADGRGNDKDRSGQDGQAAQKAASADNGAQQGNSPKGKADGDEPPYKQARFSVDPAPHSVQSHPHPVAAVQDADVSQQPVSSLSGSDSTPGLRAPAAPTSGAAGQSAGNFASGLADLAAGAPPVGLPGGIPSAPANVSSSNPSSSANRLPPARKIKGHHTATFNPAKRMERNAREKERSCRIARQIDELRALLSRGGVTVAKGTKSTVLAEAANYINLLQQQQVQWEMDRQSLVQQMQQMQANAQSAIQGQTGQAITGGTNSLNPTPNPLLPSSSASAISPDDYKHIFESSTVGMAVATLGGAFVDCNSIFSQLSDYTKEEVAVMTIFNMTSRADLQHAFDLISQMITPSDDADKDSNDDGGQSIVLRGAMKSRSDLGLSISLIRGEGGMAKCFCVTLVRILSIESTRPDTVSIELELPQICTTKRQRNIGFGSGPAYTSG